MTEFDYGNARLRAMKSRLLSRRDLEMMTNVESLQGLIAALTQTLYRKPVEAALMQATGIYCIHEALRTDLVRTFRKVRTFFKDNAEEMILMVLRRYDVQNLKSILRGLDKNASSAEIQSTLLPIGELDSDLLVALSLALGPRSVVDLLASLNLPIARPLVRLRVERPGAEMYEWELALDQWYFTESQQALSELKGKGKVLFSFFRLDADLTNLLTILRFVQFPSERKFLREKSGFDNLSPLFVGPGSLKFDFLERLGARPTLESVVEILSDSPYGAALRDGQTLFEQSRRLSDFEKALWRFRMKWMSQQIIRDPLGIGVFLGYLSSKINEINNIRRIAYGIDMGKKSDAIRLELEYVV